jgi:serine phosphatase RsbU (regulator of sigma subunit)
MFNNPDSAYILSEDLIRFTEKTGNKKWMATILNTQGATFYVRDDYVNAVKYYDRSLRIREALHDSIGIAASLHNIANVLQQMHQYKEAMLYFNRCLEIARKQKDMQGIAYSLASISSISRELKDYPKAISYQQESLDIKKKLNDRKGMSTSLNNLGNIYKELKEYDKALEYYAQSLEIDREMNDNTDISASLNNIANVYLLKGKYDSALDIATESMALAKSSNAPSIIQENAILLYDLHKIKGNFRSSLEMFELYYHIKDSLQKEENKKSVLQQQFRYEYGRKAAADSTLRAEEHKVQLAKNKQMEAIAEKREIELASKRKSEYFLYSGLGLVIIFSLFIFNRFRITRKQKSIIEIQKQVVEERQKEMLDSIKYAQRIQQALLKEEEHVTDRLPPHFILYLPKDIVSGDFYWSFERGNTLYLAAADCTGHGVPGAFLTMLGTSFLNEICGSAPDIEPGEILNQLRDRFIKELSTTDRQTLNDGMDISLVALTHAGKDGHISLQWAGANNPLWLFNPNRKDWPETLIVGEGWAEAKPDKQPIGKFDNPKPFTTHTIQLQKGDTFYIFTDGFQDQFGGANSHSRGKKFKASNLKKLLLNIQHENMHEQKSALYKVFQDWKGDLEQIDDVCIIGVRI